MWVHFIRIMTFLQKLYPVRVIYDPKTYRFEPNEKRSWLYMWINAHVIQAHLAAIYEVILYMKTESPTKLFSDFIIDILFWGLTLMCPAFVWTLWRKKAYCAWFLNQAFMHRKIREEKMDMETILLYSAVGIGLIVPVCVSSFPFVFENTAVHSVLRFYLPKFLLENKLIEKIIVGSYIGYLATQVVIVPVAMLISIVMLVIESKFFLEPVYIPGNYYQRSRSIKIKSITGLRPIPVNRAVKYYRVTFLIWRVLLDFGHVFYPSIMFGGYVVNVVTTYSVIKMRDQLPPLLIVMLALFDIVVAGVTVGIHKKALIIVEEVDKFFYYWKHEMLSGRERTCLRSLLPIRVQIGPFFCLDATTIFSTFMQVIDMTVTMLLG